MNKLSILLILIATVLYGCSTTKTATTQPSTQETAQETDTTGTEPVDFSSLLEPPKDWHHLDEERTQFRGISSQRAYEELLNSRSPQKEIVVAVIDGGVDAAHEDLKDVMWVNKDEIPDNNQDDDQNGYIDDIHGWNFIGGKDGQNVNHDTFELTRIYRKLKDNYSDADTSRFDETERQKYAYYQEIKSKYINKVNELVSQYNNIRSLEHSLDQAKQVLEQYFGDTDYTYEDIQEIQSQNQQQQFARSVMLYVMENDIDSTLIADQKKQIYEFARYGYNPEFSPRHIVGDNYEDKYERYYGNNDVAGPDPSHGTHVAGIVAAVRDNEIGINGVSTNTLIMGVRAVPNGDERDKDVANAIRYAVDNGADVINMSFGKAYSPYKKVVDKAVKYAEENGVLMVHGAGNDAKNVDKKPSYPSDIYNDGTEAKPWLTVGASSWKPGEEFVASFSNYGNQTVDLFAPGVDIYSTMPDNKYEFQDGTSMASPVVAGTAALIMTYYPQLTAVQVRDIIMENTVSYIRQEVVIPNQQGAEKPLVQFSTLSVSDGLVNIYKALKAAEALTNGY